jgi:hypothetical protein
MVTRGSIDMETIVKAAALAGALIELFATVSADLLTSIRRCASTNILLSVTRMS